MERGKGFRGGFKGLVKVAQRVVPVMAGLYVVGGVVILALNAGQIPSMARERKRGCRGILPGSLRKERKKAWGKE